MELFKQKIKPKEKTTLLAEKIKRNKNLIDELINYYSTAPKSDKGTCIEAIEIVTKDNPEFIISHIEFIIEQLSNKLPRVKWESGRIVANIASRYPSEAVKALEKLLINTKDEGTVVRWSTAFALTEIAKNNPETQKKLIAQFEKIIAKEENKGVKKIYIKF